MFDPNDLSMRTTAQDVKQWSPTDAQLAAMPRFTNAAVEEKIARLAQQLGLPMPILVDDAHGDGKAVITQEGTPFLALNSQLSDREILGIAAHELGHMKHGDPLPENVAQALNSTAVSRRHERRADEVAVELCEGRDQVYALAKSVIESGQGYRSPNGKLIINHAVKDEFHPAIGQRIAALEAGAARMEHNGSCPLPVGVTGGDIAELPESSNAPARSTPVTHQGTTKQRT